MWVWRISGRKINAVQSTNFKIKIRQQDCQSSINGVRSSSYKFILTGAWRKYIYIYTNYNYTGLMPASTIPERNSSGKSPNWIPYIQNWIIYIQIYSTHPTKMVQSLTFTFQFYLIWSGYRLVHRKLPSPKINLCQNANSASDLWPLLTTTTKHSQII